MVTFSSDVDLARYEPVLFGELYRPEQILAAGEGGGIAGTTFSDSGADFTSGGVEAGDVLYVRSGDGLAEGIYEVVSVDSATELTVSVIRADSEAAVIAPQAGESLIWRISTYKPQSAEAGLRLTEYFGIRPGDPSSQYGVENIVDAGPLRVVSVFLVLSAVYAAYASKGAGEDFWKKSMYYKDEFEKAMGRVEVGIDADGDGISDVSLSRDSIRLIRE
jgi:hypothetical protein